MIRLAVSVEGPTEEAFVNQVLASHLREMLVEPTPILLNGNVTVERLASEMARLFWNYDYVTSLVDFYGFKCKGTKSPEKLEEVAFEAVDCKIKRSWDQSRILPYVQRHEFEGLLFTDVDAFNRVAGASSKCVEELRKSRSYFNTPEDIDDGKCSAPSKRILRLMPNYQKIVHGVDIATEIGLEVIRCQCPRFHEWMTKLESLAEKSISSR